jgi:hypothetical protein
MNSQTRQPPENFELYPDHASYTPIGVVSLAEALTLLTKAIIYSREEGIKRLLVDARKLTGFQSPSLPQRYWIGRRFAANASDAVAVALVLEPHLIDPGRFGVIVAWNLGMRVDVFTEITEARTWLLSDTLPSVISQIG